MFEDLLESLQNSIKQARTTAASLNRELKESRVENGRDEQLFHDPTHTLGKAVSFGKSQRFKELEKQQPKTTDSFFQISQLLNEKQKKGIAFGKEERFIGQKEDELTIINPNYDCVKKNNKQAPRICKDSKQLMGKSRVSQITAASESEVGPGKYFIDQSQQIKKRTAAFSKSKRFQKQKIEYQDTPLFPEVTLTKKRPPTAALMKPKMKQNQKQISIQKQEELRERLKMVYWKSIPLELDRLLKRHEGAPILKEKYFDLKKLEGSQRRCAILMLLNRLNEERGGLDLNIAKSIGDGPCGVVYRKSTPKPFKFSEVEPGPDYYYPQDDLAKPALIGYSFAKKEQNQKPIFDNRDYDINEEYFKLGGNVIIAPEHQPHRLTEDEMQSLNRGPGFYDCLFSQVEKRTDIGVLKFTEINEKNARENNCVEAKEVNDALYYPSYDAIDPNVAGPLFKEPANVKPAHLPDKQLFPEHWLFYDGDLNKVRAQIAKNVLIAKGMNFQTYKKYANKFQAFRNYLEERRRLPEALTYEKNYDAIDAHIEGFDMKKKIEKTLNDPIVKEEGSVEGDNLLLEPEKPGKKLADINFKKMVGRQDEEMGHDEVREGDILILEPRKLDKHIGDIIFDKMVSREEINIENNPDEQPAEGDRVILHPKMVEKNIPSVNFAKQSQRPELIKQEEKGDEVVINPDKPKRIKGFVELQRMTATRLVPYLRKNKEKASTIEKKH